MEGEKEMIVIPITEFLYWFEDALVILLILIFLMAAGYYAEKRPGFAMIFIVLAFLVMAFWILFSV